MRLMFWRRPRPKGGDRFIVKTPFTAFAMTYWRAPVTGGDDVLLPQGLILVVEDDPVPAAQGVSALPDPFDEWEARFISEEIRADEKYAGFALKIGFDELEKFCSRG